MGRCSATLACAVLLPLLLAAAAARAPAPGGGGAGGDGHLWRVRASLVERDATAVEGDETAVARVRGAPPPPPDAGKVCGRPCDTSFNCTRSSEHDLSTAPSPCNVCERSVCVSKHLLCGRACASPVDCIDSPACSVCAGGHCSSNGLCGSFCEADADCFADVCHACVANQCVVPCGGACFEDSHCQYKNSTCPQCVNYACQRGGCGSECLHNADCAGQGNCTSCVHFRCSSTCGGPCESDDQCSGADTGCGFCNHGVCDKGVCGSACSSNDGCSYPCSRCGRKSGQCEAARGCDELCVEDTDCDAGSDCSVCLEHRCRSPQTPATPPDAR